MTINPLSVLCPTCLARPGQSCLGIIAPTRGVPCDPHQRRKERAISASLSEELRKRGWGLVPPVGEDQTPDNEEESMNNGETDGLGATPDTRSDECTSEERCVGECREPACIASPDVSHTHAELQGVEKQYDDGITVVQQFKLVEPNAQEGVDALKKNLKEDDLLLAVRCPCGFMLGLAVPREAYTQADAAALATKALKQLIPMLAQHLDKDLTEHLCPLREIAQPKEG